MSRQRPTKADEKINAVLIGMAAAAKKCCALVLLGAEQKLVIVRHRFEDVITYNTDLNISLPNQFIYYEKTTRIPHFREYQQVARRN